MDRVGSLAEMGNALCRPSATYIPNEIRDGLGISTPSIDIADKSVISSELVQLWCVN